MGVAYTRWSRCLCQPDSYPYVGGFGMDVAGRYRELPDVAVYDAEVEREAAVAARAPHA